MKAVGNWELRNELCGWSGPKTYAAGNGSTITLYCDGRYQSMFQGLSFGHYVVTERLNSSQQMQRYVYFDGSWNHEYRLDIANGIMTLDNGDYISDGCEYKFERY